MKTRMKSFLLNTSSAIAVVLLAFSFAGVQTVRADDSELSLPIQETVLVPVKDVQALKQRVEYLEETIATLSESWQHLDKRRICVSDDSGAETCISKAQLDALFTSQAHAEEISHPKVDVAATVTPPSEEPITLATTVDKSEPETAPVNETSQDERQPAQTGALSAVPAVELNVTPDAEALYSNDLP